MQENYLGSCAVHVVEDLPPHTPAHPPSSVRDLDRDVIFRLEYPTAGRETDINCLLNISIDWSPDVW